MENLPIEILLKVFDYLDSESIKSASNACQRFKSIIHNDVSIMNKFTVNIKLSNINTIKEQLSDMPYRRFDINASQCYTEISLNQFYGKVMSVVQDHIGYIEKLRFSDTATGLATKILGNLKNLTHLSIENVIKTGIEEDNIALSVDLPNLKQLEVTGDDSYLKFIKCSQVAVLNYRNKNKFSEQSSRVSLVLNNFLQRSPNLKDFTLLGVAPNFEVEKFKFNLEKLNFANSFINNNQGEKNPMIQLLLSQKDNVKDLTVTGYVTQKILETAINKMKNLKKFKVDLEKISVEPANLTVNKTLKQLELINLPNYQQHASKIIKNCTTVETLKIFSLISQNFLAEISNSMRNLQHMTLKSVTDLIISELSFGNLKSLTILNVTNIVQPANIIKISVASPNLHELYIRNAAYEIQPPLLKNLIFFAKKMEILRITGNVVFDHTTLEVLQNVKTNLRILWLDIDVEEETFEIAEILDQTKIQCIIPGMNALENYYDYFADSNDVLEVMTEGWNELIRVCEEESDGMYESTSEEDESKIADIGNEQDDNDSSDHDSDSEILTFVIEDQSDTNDSDAGMDVSNESENDLNLSRNEDATESLQISSDGSLLIEIGIQKRSRSNGGEQSVSIEIRDEPKESKSRKLC